MGVVADDVDGGVGVEAAGDGRERREVKMTPLCCAEAGIDAWAIDGEGAVSSSWLRWDEIQVQPKNTHGTYV